jgi:hypothetical protein
LLGSAATAAASTRVLHTSSLGAAATTLASAAATLASRTADASTLAAVAAFLHFGQITESGIGGGSSAAAALAFVSIRRLDDAQPNPTQPQPKHSHAKKRPDLGRSRHDHISNQEKE